MVKDGDLVALFHSIHRVMKAESLLKGERIPMLLIPAPRALHADCGLAIRYSPEARAAVERLLAENRLEPEEIFVKNGDAYIKISGPKESE